MFRRMPAPVRALRDAWPSQVPRVPHLTEALEKDFRFGQQISKTERGYLMGGTIKGGSSSMWYPSTRDEYEAYVSWKEVEGLAEERDDAAYRRLRRILDEAGIELVTRRHRALHAGEAYPGFGRLYELSADILEALPPSHLARPTLRRIELGGWGPDSAKASAYRAPAVLMYDFALRGARRTFLGLFLHELGHAHEQAFAEPLLEELRPAHQLLAESDALMGVEFLLDRSTRKLYQKLVFGEFLAETYLIYTACGAALRTFVEALPEAPRAAWEKVYAAFRETFEGIEYE